MVTVIPNLPTRLVPPRVISISLVFVVMSRYSHLDKRLSTEAGRETEAPRPARSLRDLQRDPRPDIAEPVADHFGRPLPTRQVEGPGDLEGRLRRGPHGDRRAFGVLHIHHVHVESGRVARPATLALG